MTVFLVVTGFSLVLVNDDLFGLIVLYYGSGNSCGCNVCANLKSVIAYCKHLIKRNSLASLYSKLLYVNDIALGYFVLFTTCCNNCVHMAPPIIITR